MVYNRGDVIVKGYMRFKQVWVKKNEAVNFTKGIFGVAILRSTVVL